MPTRNVNLTPELDRFVHSRIKTGRYENASEVVRAALRTLERKGNKAALPEVTYLRRCAGNSSCQNAYAEAWRRRS